MCIGELREKYPKKFVTDLERVFEGIHGGDRIFIGTGCGKPSYLVKELISYTKKHPKAFADAEVLHVWTLGVAPYVSQEFEMNFRHNAFFIGDNTRGAVNAGHVFVYLCYYDIGIFNCRFHDIHAYSVTHISVLIRI